MTRYKKEKNTIKRSSTHFLTRTHWSAP